MTRLALFGPWVCFFLFFSSILLTTKAHSSQRRPPKANAGPRKPTAANAGQCRPTKAHGSQRRPMQAHESPRQRLGPFFRHSIHHHHHWGPRRVSGLQFLFISFILFYISQGPRRVSGLCLFYFILF